MPPMRWARSKWRQGKNVAEIPDGIGPAQANISPRMLQASCPSSQGSDFSAPGSAMQVAFNSLRVMPSAWVVIIGLASASRRSIRRTYERRCNHHWLHYPLTLVRRAGLSVSSLSQTAKPAGSSLRKGIQDDRNPAAQHEDPTKRAVRTTRPQ